MGEQPIFQAPTKNPGEVRLYPNRVEIDRRKLFSTFTRTVFLRNVSQLWYSGGNGISLAAPNNTSVGVVFKHKEDAQALHRALSTMIGRDCIPE